MKASSFVKMVLTALFVLLVSGVFAQTDDSDFDRAEQLYKEQNYKKAIVFYKKAADEGNVSAQYALANCYYYGQGVERNVNTAVEMWRKCAESGNVEAQNRMGACYYEGEAVEKNYDEAARWWKSAAEQGNMYAQFDLGICYYNGQVKTANSRDVHEMFCL